VEEGTTPGDEGVLRTDWIESEWRRYRIGSALRRLAEDLAQARRRVAVLERENRELRARLEQFTACAPEAGQEGHASTGSGDGSGSR
jgi:hypothetical protein